MAAKTSFSCGSALDITQASALHERLTTSLGKSSVIELKANKVEKADTAGLQLMACLLKAVEQSGGQLIWKQPSQTLIDTATLLGLDQRLKITQ